MIIGDQHGQGDERVENSQSADNMFQVVESFVDVDVLVGDFLLFSSVLVAILAVVIKGVIDYFLQKRQTDNSSQLRTVSSEKIIE